MMYDELVKCLRRCGYCDDSLDCDCCEYNNTTEYTDRECSERLMLQAADAIEELISDREMYRDAMTIEHNRAATLQWEREHRWIPVTEWLPEEQDEYLVLWRPRNRINDKLYCAILESEDGGWVDDIPQAEPFGGFEVLYWMPLPEPPKEE